jgi:hypothetical protein
LPERSGEATTSGVSAEIKKRKNVIDFTLSKLRKQRTVLPDGLPDKFYLPAVWYFFRKSVE